MSLPPGRPSISVVEPEIDALRHLQASTIEALDTKAGVVLGFSVTILAVFSSNLGANLPTLALIGVVFVSFAVIVGVIAMLPRDYRFDPKPEVLLHEYMLRDPETPTTGAREQILADKVEAYSKNQGILKKKASLVFAAATFLGVGALFLSAEILWRNTMVKSTPPPSEKAPSTTVQPPPVAKPNPNAANTIKKGVDHLNLEK